MPVGAIQAREWVDGFLMVGNHPSLDLLNTRLVNAEGPVELLPDTDSLARWLIAARIVRNPAAIAAIQTWHRSSWARAFLGELLEFRERLRRAVLQLESVKVGEEFLRELNSKLLLYPRRYILKRGGNVIERSTFLELKRPDELWSEIAGSASDLLTEVTFARVRKCEGCVVHFFDISKKGSRRWCSMNLCGNRSKVATYRQMRSKSRS